MADWKNTEPGILITGTAAADSILNGAASTWDVFYGTQEEYEASLVRTDSVTIDSGAGDDRIFNESGTNVSINGGSGNDLIFNTSTEEPSKCDGSNSTLIGGDGDDDISNGSNNVLIDAGNGDDVISIYYGGNSTINAGSGNDSIDIEWTWGNLIDAGEGNDTIRIHGSNNTIVGGKGNELISNEAKGKNNLIKYTEGDGNDTLSGFNDEDTLKIGDGTGTYSAETIGSDVIVTVGEGKITLQGAASIKALNIAGKNSNPLVISNGSRSINNSLDGATVQALGGYATVSNSGSNVYISGDLGGNRIDNNGDNVLIDVRERAPQYYTSGNGDYESHIIDYRSDTVKNRGSFVTINGGGGYGDIERGESHARFSGLDNTGHDYIYNYGSNVLIDAYSGDDYIENYGSNSTIYGGYDDDKIYNSGSNNTINSGAGNDSISLGSSAVGNVIQYAGEGNDIISNYTAANKISLGAAPSAITVSGMDAVLKFEKGTLTVKDCRAYEMKIISADGTEYSTIIAPDSALTDKSPYFKLLPLDMEFADASSRTKAIQIIGNRKSNIIVGGEGNDYLYGVEGNDTLAGGNGNDKLYGGAGKDSLSGGSGNDSLWSGGDNDIMDGNAGNDKLFGESGNDSLWGGSGNDIFVYKPGEGTDHIKDFSGGDMLKILKTNGEDGRTFTSATFSGRNLTLAISGGGSVVLDNVNSGQSININGTSYKISGKTLK